MVNTVSGDFSTRSASSYQSAVNPEKRSIFFPKIHSNIFRAIRIARLPAPLPSSVETQLQKFVHDAADHQRALCQSIANQIKSAYANQSSELNLSGLGLGKLGAQAVQLIQIIGQLTHLRVLDLSCNFLNELGQQSGLFAEAVGKLSFINTLNLAHNSLFALQEHFAHFVMSFHPLSKLHSLDLFNNQLGSLSKENAKSFLESLYLLKQIRQLDLRDNHLDYLGDYYHQFSALPNVIQ